MKQQPDKLFRDKLEDYTRPAPTRAWDKIEANLDKKRPVAIWYKLAASLLLVAGTTYILWQINTQPARGTQPTLAALPATQPKDTAAANKTTQPVVQTMLAVQNVPSTNPVAQVAAPAKTYNRKKTVTPPAQTQAPVQIIEETTQPIAANNTEANTVQQTAAVEPAPEINTTNTYASTAAATTAPASGKTITLVYSAREANEYLDKKGLDEATSDDTKPSTLKKLLKKAADLDPIGELRQRKNEILALSFKNEKQRGQNK